MWNQFYIFAAYKSKKMNDDDLQPLLSDEKVIGDNIQPPKYEEKPREEFTRIEIENENKTSESEIVRRNQDLESILENQQRQLQRLLKKDQMKGESALVLPIVFLFMFIVCIILKIYEWLTLIF